MAKIGTVHVEVKPVFNQVALDDLAKAIEDAVRRGVEAGMSINVGDATFFGVDLGEELPRPTCGPFADER